MQYEPRNPHHLRYEVGKAPSSEKLLKTIEEYTLKLCNYLGYDFNTVEFAVRDGVPIAIDFCNPAPDADLKSVGQENFDWVVETTANYAIERAKAQKPNQDNLTWGKYVKSAAAGLPLVAKVAAKTKSVKPAVASKPKVKKAVTPKAKTTSAKK
jgi:hypothetical protein